MRLMEVSLEDIFIKMVTKEEHEYQECQPHPQSGTEILYQLVYSLYVIIMFLLMTGYFFYNLTATFSIVSYQAQSDPCWQSNTSY